jgi:hypothetical protein
MTRVKQHSTLRRSAAVSCLLFICAGAAHARAPLLPGSAFVQARPCVAEPFGDVGADEREQRLAGKCADAERLQINADGPRLQPDKTPPVAPFKLGFDQIVTRPITRLFITNFRLGWTGSNPERQNQNGLQTERAMVAAGGMLRLDEHFAMDMNVGRDVGMGLRTRTTMSGMWRPADERMLIAQVAEEPTGGTASTLGLRWWLVHKRVAFDFLARRAADSAVVEPRIGLSIFDIGR